MAVLRTVYNACLGGSASGKVAIISEFEAH